jgi:hypothetical protein
MNKYAVVVNGVVTNVALWDGQTDWAPDGEVILLADGISAGPKWTYSNGIFTEPVDPEEQE